MSKQGKISQQSLPEKTADALLNRIHMEGYQVGAKLPNEIELADYFEVSRTTIRQAISILRERGILRTERGSGTFVADFPGINDLQSDPLGLSLIYDKKVLIKDLLELRMLIEPKCAMLAAQNASQKDILHLLELCDEMDELVKNNKSYVQNDMAFHQTLANSCGNVVLHNLIPYIHEMHVLTNQNYLKVHGHEVAREHRRIAEAIRDHRGADAYDAMSFHLMVLERSY